jgi:Fe-S cluster assembly protein SufD
MSAIERMLGEFSALGAAGGAAAGAAGAGAAAAALRAHGLPTRRDENWHYADLRSLESVARFRAQPPANGGAAQPLPLPEPLAGYTRLVFVDGMLCNDWPLPGSTAVARLPPERMAATQAGTTDYESRGDGRMALVARMFAPDPLALQISGSAALELIHVASSAAANCHTRVSLDLAAGANLNLVERQLGCVAAAADQPPQAALHCTNLELRLGAGALLRHTRLQQVRGSSLRFHTLSADLAADASYELRHVAVGDGSERSSAQIRLQGRAASVQTRVLAAARASQSADLQYTVLHEAPGTRSDQLFRGIASDRAHVSCSADVQAAASAPGSRVLQSLRGLIDGQGAAVNLRPRLTINTDEIQAQHGATTGRLDEDLLYYLLARGLEPATARSLLKWALLGEVLSAIDPPALRRSAELAAAAQLHDTPARELLQ